MKFEERAESDPELAGLLDAAFAELVAKYGAGGRSHVREGARYLVLSVEGRAVGCGAIQPFDAGIGELKRMYVAPDFRGRGLARKLLAELEDLALAAGFVALRLATGHKQPEAIGLYESSGYEQTEPYGKYVDQPGTHCYYKRLVAETALPPGIGKVARAQGDPDPAG
ncbi:GNAT family N-acetyltransferase [Flindersiella endophytica]